MLVEAAVLGREEGLRHEVRHLVELHPGAVLAVVVAGELDAVGGVDLGREQVAGVLDLLQRREVLRVVRDGAHGDERRRAATRPSMTARMRPERRRRSAAGPVGRGGAAGADGITKASRPDGSPAAPSPRAVVAGAPSPPASGEWKNAERSSSEAAATRPARAAGRAAGGRAAAGRAVAAAACRDSGDSKNAASSSSGVPGRGESSMRSAQAGQRRASAGGRGGPWAVAGPAQERRAAAVEARVAPRAEPVARVKVGARRAGDTRGGVAMSVNDELGGCGIQACPGGPGEGVGDGRVGRAVGAGAQRHPAGEAEAGVAGERVAVEARHGRVPQRAVQARRQASTARAGGRGRGRRRARPRRRCPSSSRSAASV